jgi:hypothetical protein
MKRSPRSLRSLSLAAGGLGPSRSAHTDPGPRPSGPRGGWRSLRSGGAGPA